MFNKLKEMASGKADEIMLQQMPKVAQYYREKVGPLTRETLANDELMTKGLGIVYEIVSTSTPGFSALVKKDKFTEFCLANRSKLPLG